VLDKKLDRNAPANLSQYAIREHTTTLRYLYIFTYSVNYTYHKLVRE